MQEPIIEKLAAEYRAAQVDIEALAVRLDTFGFGAVARCLVDATEAAA